MEFFFHLSPTTTIVCALALFFVVYVLRHLALPKPYPGIPYHAHSAQRVLGDVPDLLEWQSQSPERKFDTWAWIREQNAKLQSPIIQLFVRPLGKPFIIVSDWREAQDVMSKRNKDFDRSDFFRDLFGLILPRTFAHFKTNEVYWHHRRLMASTMSTSFLQSVAAPQIYDKTLDLVDLWKEKGRLAPSRAFSVKEDVFRTSFDMIWASTFSSDIGVVNTQLLAGLEGVELSENPNEPAQFPTAEEPAAFRPITSLAQSIETVAQTPILPVFTHWLQLKLTSRLRWAVKRKNKMLTNLVGEAVMKFQWKDAGKKQVASALELIVQREATAAEKEHRQARFDGPEIRDELLSLLIGGQGTTSNTLCWGLKLLTLCRDVQIKLQNSFKEAFPRRCLAKSAPTLEEILQAELPYLDAVIEEIHRYSGTVPAISRNATDDVQLLQQVIPKGAEVFFLIDGPSYTAAPIRVKEASRSHSSQADIDKTLDWNPLTISHFLPERWLVDEDGKAKFNPNAGPMHAFGVGPRGCFGRKFAQLELRVLLTLILWNFDLKSIPYHLHSFAGHDKILHEPERCYVQVAKRS